MINFRNRNAVTVGEAMVEMAITESGLYKRGFAGDTFNTAWHMAQAMVGIGQVGFITRVGTDTLSDAFVAELAADGLVTGHIERDPHRTMGLYMIELDGVERHFHYWRSASAARQLAADRTALKNAFSGIGLIHLSGITLAILQDDHRNNLLAALASARSDGAIISFDPNIRPRLWQSMDEIRRIIPQALHQCDIALPSFDDENLVWGDESPSATIARIVKCGASEVVVKNGAGPISYWANGAEAAQQTPTVTGILDTTGAGDAFNAGYLAVRLKGQSPAKAVAVGQRFSGQVIQHYGARLPKSALPTFD